MARPDPDSDVRRRFTLAGDENWPAVAADRIVELVGDVKDKTTDNVVLAVRAVVYGLAALAGVIVLVTLLAITAVRVADAYLPIGAGVGSGTWAAHLFVGALISVVGAGLWRARTRSARSIHAALIVDAVILVGIVFYGTVAGLI